MPYKDRSVEADGRTKATLSAIMKLLQFDRCLRLRLLARGNTRAGPARWYGIMQSDRSRTSNPLTKANLPRSVNQAVFRATPSLIQKQNLDAGP